MHRYIVREYNAKIGFRSGKRFPMKKFAVLAGTLLAATLAAPTFNTQLILHAAPDPVGKAVDGKVFWQAQMCQYCHGVQAEGAWGPDLAGRGFTQAQMIRALRQPYGLMPAYTETQVSEQTIADLLAQTNRAPPPKCFCGSRLQPRHPGA